MNFDYEENGGKNAVLANPKHQYRVWVAKRVAIVMGIQVCLISWINFDYKENGGNKAFLTNPKHEYCVS